MHASTEFARNAATIALLPEAPHPRVELRASNLPTLFDAAALATFALLRLSVIDSPGRAMAPDALRAALAAEGERITVRTLALSGRDTAELLVHWLRELLWLHESQAFLYTSARIITLDPALCAEVRGVHARAAPLRELKGVTYHDLAVNLVADGWIAHVSYDL